jgi:hypothetical protein
MTAFAVLSVGVRGEVKFLFANADELDVAHLKEAADMGSCGGDKICIAAARTGHGLPRRDGQAQPALISLRQIGQIGGIGSANDDRDQSRRIHHDRQGSPDRSSKNALSAQLPVAGGSGWAWRKAASGPAAEWLGWRGPIPPGQPICGILFQEAAQFGELRDQPRGRIVLDVKRRKDLQVKYPNIQTRISEYFCHCTLSWPSLGSWKPRRPMPGADRSYAKVSVMAE